MVNPDSLTFYQQWQDIINILLGALFASLSSFVLFFVSNNYKVRNFFLDEFKVYIDFNTREVVGDEVKGINVHYEITNRNSTSEYIVYAFWVLPNGYKGRYDPDYTLSEALFGDGKDYDSHFKDKEVQRPLIGKVGLNDVNMLRAINDKRLGKLQLVVCTSKYGWVKSNSLKL